ncbi:MAG: hypothetical protein IJ506_05820 [Clostridia bacterium]|nr:hypothetical protein [Clostridia bacterium]
MTKKITAFTAGWLYSFIHFSVEVACFYFLFSRISASLHWWALAMLFDALAFLPQSFFGILSDKYPHLPYGFIGCAMLLLSLLLPFDLLALTVLGIGNALAHIDGAQHTLRNNRAKMTPNAVFVGGGSFGVITGQLLGALKVDALVLIPLLLTAISAVLAIFVTKAHNVDIEKSEEYLPLGITVEMPDSLLIVLMLFAVSIRSYVAYAIPIEWKKNTLQAIALFSFMGLGKGLGGVFADTLGFRKTTYLSLLIALPFLLFGNSVMALSLVGIMLFSMTMPVTVGVLVSKFPDKPGFAFGITTVGLFLGVVPEFFFTLPSLFAHQIAVLLLSAIALISILVCLKRRV